MTDIARVVEHQSTLSSYKATKHENRAEQLELLIELSKPSNRHQTWHRLIATPFRYPPPQPQHQARFRPAYGRNVFYGSIMQNTALYEYSYHFMKQRTHIQHKTPDAGMRTIFIVGTTEYNAHDISSDANLAAIMDKNNYTASHAYIKNNPNITFIRYPSCRDPSKGSNIAVLDINHLSKTPKWETTIKFFYDFSAQKISWIDYNLHIDWQTVS